MNMELAKRIDQDFIEAMKTKNEAGLAVLRMLRAALKNKSIELKKELQEADIIAVIRSEIKKRKDSAEAYAQGSRPDLQTQELSEIKVLQKYLPAELSTGDLKAKVERIIAALTEEDRANFGKAMSAVMSELKGQADGAAVSAIVKEVLSA